MRLATAFTGEILGPTDSGYEIARKVHNGLIDKRLALIARCRGVADIVDGLYVNYLGDDEKGDVVAAAYGPNYRRLATVKAQYDPEDFFRMNQNIRLAA
jgi:hypothetical protein